MTSSYVATSALALRSVGAVARRLDRLRAIAAVGDLLLGAQLRLAFRYTAVVDVVARPGAVLVVLVAPRVRHVATSRRGWLPTRSGMNRSAVWSAGLRAQAGGRR